MEQTKKLNMTAMSDKTNSNTTAKKEEPAWEHKVAMKVSGVSIAVNLDVYKRQGKQRTLLPGTFPWCTGRKSIRC